MQVGNAMRFIYMWLWSEVLTKIVQQLSQLTTDIHESVEAESVAEMLLEKKTTRKETYYKVVRWTKLYTM